MTNTADLKVKAALVWHGFNFYSVAWNFMADVGNQSFTEALLGNLCQYNQALQVSVSHVQCNQLKVICRKDLETDLALHI